MVEYLIVQWQEVMTPGDVVTINAVSPYQNSAARIFQTHSKESASEDWYARQSNIYLIRKKNMNRFLDEKSELWIYLK